VRVWARSRACRTKSNRCNGGGNRCARPNHGVKQRGVGSDRILIIWEGIWRSRHLLSCLMHLGLVHEKRKETTLQFFESLRATVTVPAGRPLAGTSRGTDVPVRIFLIPFLTLAEFVIPRLTRPVSINWCRTVGPHQSTLATGFAGILRLRAGRLVRLWVGRILGPIFNLDSTVEGEANSKARSLPETKRTTLHPG